MARPTTAPSAPASDRILASSNEVTPPDAMTLQGHLEMKSLAWHASMPFLWPSTSTLVFRTAARGRSSMRSNMSWTVSSAASCHPLTAMRPPLVSIESTILSGNSSAISASQSGSLTAFVPTMTRSIPAHTRSSTVSLDLIPPPISTGTPHSSAILLKTGRLPSFPKAPSRSTRWRYLAPFSIHISATETGSGMTICWLPGTPPTSWTTWWSITSTAGMTLISGPPRM